MPAHGDILDRPDRLTVPFWVSLTLHIAIVGALTVQAVVRDRLHLNMGSPNGGGIGVLVQPVNSIPIPSHGGPQNPVANNTQSQVPTPPIPREKPKPVAKEAPPKKAPTADELLLDKIARSQPKRVDPNKFREKQTYNPSQLYTDAGQRLSSPDYGVQGGGGVKIGDNSPFGDQFAAYADQIRQNIANNWKPTGTNVPAVVVTFTILKDGSVTHVNISKSSGNQAMDFSAERAVDGARLPPLPAGFPRNQADVELTFELGK